MKNKNVCKRQLILSILCSPNQLGRPTFILLDDVTQDCLESVLCWLGAAKHREIFDLESINSN